jgi:hypothetical protein
VICNYETNKHSIFIFYIVIKSYSFDSDVDPLSRIYIYKGKAIPLHAWTGPEGSRKLRLPDFKTIGT